MALDWDLCYAVNVKAHVFLMREALASFNSTPDGGAFIITSSIAGRIPVSPTSEQTLSVLVRGKPISASNSSELSLILCLCSNRSENSALISPYYYADILFRAAVVCPTRSQRQLNCILCGAWRALRAPRSGSMLFYQDS